MNVERQSFHGYMASRGHASSSKNTNLHALVTEHTLLSSFFSVAPPTITVAVASATRRYVQGRELGGQDGVDCSLQDRSGGRTNSSRVGGVPLDKHCLST